jgi:hypothetical protein
MVGVDVDVGVDVGDVDWVKAGVDRSDVNLLVFSYRLRDYYSNHLRLREHLYLDRTRR